VPALIPVLAGALGITSPFGLFAFQLGASLVLSGVAQALARKQARGSPTDLLRELQIPTSRPAKRFVYGKTRMAGSWCPGWVVKDGYLYGCVILNSRPSDGTGFKLFADKREVTLIGTVTNFATGATATAAPFVDHLTCWLGLGDQTGPPAQIMTEMGDVTSTDPEKFWPTDRFSNCTVLWVRLLNGDSSDRQERWPRTPPEIEVEMQWSKVWDPRDGAQDADDPATWEWSDNQALCLLDAMRTNPVRQREVRQILLNTFEDAADVADEAVDLGAGGTEPRYRANGFLVWSDTQELLDQIEPLAVAGAGSVISAGGQVGYAAGAWRAPVFTADDVLADRPWQFTRLRSGRDMARAVRCSFVDPAAEYEMSTLLADAVPGGIGTPGGDDAIESIELTFVTSATQAMRIQRITARRRGLQKAMSCVLPPTAFDLMSGAAVTVDLARAGDARNGIYEITQMHPGEWLEDESGVALRLPVTMTEVTEEVYDWATTDEQALYAQGFTPINAAIAMPGAIVATTGTGINLNTGGTVIPRLKFAFDPSTTTSIEGYEWEFAEGSDPYQPGGFIDAAVRDGSGDVFGFLTPNAGATVKIRVRAARGVARSAWREITGVAIAFSVTSAAMTAEPGRVRVTGTGPSPNLSGVKVYRAATGAGFGAAVDVSGVLPVASGAAFNVIAGDATRTNLFTNADFAAGATGWTVATDWSVGSGVATKVAGAANRIITQAPSLTAGDVLRGSFTITAFTAGQFAFRCNGTPAVTGPVESTTGRKVATLTVPTSPTSIGVLGTPAAAGSVDDLLAFVQTPSCLAQGAADFFVVPVSTTGVEGTPSGPFALLIP
jgi:hypothetical protein